MEENKAKHLLNILKMNTELARMNTIRNDLKRMLDKEFSDNMVVDILIARGGYFFFLNRYFDLRKEAINMKLVTPTSSDLYDIHQIS